MDPGVDQRQHGILPSNIESGTYDSSPSSPVDEVTEQAQYAAEAMATHDSMVTVRLSEPPSLTINTNIPSNAVPSRHSMFGNVDTPTSTMADTTKDDSASFNEDDSTFNDEDSTDMMPAVMDGSKSLAEELNDTDSLTSSGDTEEESDQEDVDWEELQKTEDAQVKDQESDNSTAMLLARLEQENDKLATNPKSVKVQVVDHQSARRPRPPSMAQLKQMVNGPTPPELRYSMLPPPPMTDLEFYMALVKDYQQTAARLPTLLSNKIRKGIPPPLRGVVWQSMAGAHDSFLLADFERLSGESSPYEGIIGKDLGRSFPGVEMFRDPDGEGQRMLGRVLKCFSLYDQKIGYCQGLAFLVGPLLMHMPDSQAFCVLVRLMENYDLRSCFLPDLSGLHVRIFQFRELLQAHLPILWAHLEELQVDPAYVSQWFLSFFAVTCPLPMLFRIYDVIFAEGASETIMRVALSLMRKNESRILASNEIEDVMQLLLSRGLWDCYHYNADEFVDDFTGTGLGTAGTGISQAVTREKLAQLEQRYRELQSAGALSGSGGLGGAASADADAARSSVVTTAASRFLGRLWTTNNSNSPISRSSTLSPGANPPSRQSSMLRRSASKQSLASTLNSIDASSTSALSSTSTDLTRDSNNTDDSLMRESTPIAQKSNSIANPDRNLHTQIEDLLTALSELQRNHALLATQLQKEREEREDDKKAVRSLLDGIRQKANPDSTAHNSSTESSDDKPRGVHIIHGEGSPAQSPPSSDTSVNTDAVPTAEDLSSLLDVVESRFETASPQNSQPSSTLMTKSQLQDEVSRMKEQLHIEQSRSAEYDRRLEDLGQETTQLKEQLRDSHAHVRNLHQDKQRLEKQVHTMRMRTGSDTPRPTNPNVVVQAPNDVAGTAANMATAAGGWLASFSTQTSASATGGLRELKLGRSKSTPNPQAGFVANNKRSSSLNVGALARTQTEPVTAPVTPDGNEHDQILLELVQAKTAEAVARQEAEEAKQKLETFKKTYGVPTGDNAGTATGATSFIGKLTGSTSDVPVNIAAAKPATPAATNSGGGFWGWRR